jgi:hypothetical protein
MIQVPALPLSTPQHIPETDPTSQDDASFDAPVEAPAPEESDDSLPDFPEEEEETSEAPIETEDAAPLNAPQAQALAGDNYINGEVYNGDATYYTEWSTGYGSCGAEYQGIDDYLVALSPKWMANSQSNNANEHPLCAPQYCVQVDGPLGSIVAKVRDTCLGCSDNDIDLADSVYQNVADVEQGRAKVNWYFVDCNTKAPGPVIETPTEIHQEQYMPSPINAEIPEEAPVAQTSTRALRKTPKH